MFRWRPAGGVALAIPCALAGAFGGAPIAQAKSIGVDARVQVGVVSAPGSALEFAGAVSDPGIGNGGLLATVRPASGGAYAGRAKFVNSSGSITADLRATPRLQGALVHESLTAVVSAATGRFAGAHGTLTGSGTITAAFGVGVLRLHGTLRGAAGRAPGPMANRGIRHAHARFQGVEVSLKRSGEETVVGSATGLLPGGAVAVVHDRATTTSVSGTFSVFGAGASLTGVIHLRFRDRGSVRSESGTATITGGAGSLSGARSISPAALTGRRNLISQLVDLTIRGAFRP